MDRAAAHVTVDGLAMLGAEDHRAYLEAVGRGRREALMAKLLKEAVRPGSTFVDVGAFLGHFTLLAARAAGPSGHVHAFEPDPRDHPWLVRNIEANGFTDRVTPEPMAVSDRTEAVLLHLAQRDRTQSSIVLIQDSRDSTPVPAVALDEHLPSDAEVSVVKIDVEGAEIRALRGMQGILGASPGVALFIEVNPSALEAAGASTDALLECLVGLGFDFQLIDEERWTLAPFDGRVQGVNFVNLMCIKGDPLPGLESATAFTP